MMACGGLRLELERTRVTVQDPKGEAEGVRSRLRVWSGERLVLELDALERGPLARWVHLRAGTYTVRMDHWTPRSGGPARRSLRVLGVYDDHVHFHPGNWPRELEGCIAPGMAQAIGGVVRSTEALERVFAELGGYVEGAEFELTVD